jgi:hypothetical protein
VPDILLSIVCGGAGLFLAVAGCRELLSLRSFRRRALRAPGLVVGLRRDGVPDEGAACYPIIRFTTLDGRQVEARARIGGNPPLCRPGRQVTVLYDPARPADISLSGPVGSGAVFFGILLCVGLGLLFLAAGTAIDALGAL